MPSFLKLLFSLTLSSLLLRKSNSRTYCYTGSNLYQLQIQDCGEKNPSYNGTWYCAKMEICESFISSSRICAATRGCATVQECTSSSDTIYSGETIEVDGTYPGGMKITTSCCASHEFANDDNVAIDYDLICNGSSVEAVKNIMISILCIVLLLLVLSQ